MFINDRIAKYFGKCESVFHETASPDIHTGIAIMEPSGERGYYTPVVLLMSKH